MVPTFDDRLSGEIESEDHNGSAGPLVLLRCYQWQPERKLESESIPIKRKR